MRARLTFLSMLALLTATTAFGQAAITLPPSGDNQHATVTQSVGPVKVTIDYHSPKVHSPFNGEDRRGKIWGGLVPWGMAKGLGYGTCTECPWRVGANENTVFSTSNDIKVEGQPLPAGSYGLHMIPGQDEWTIIFSKNFTSWGSFFYDPSEDFLRIKVKPAKSEYNEYMTFEFSERKPDRATVAMRWEDLQVPFTITVDNVASIYLDTIRKELHGSKGFAWINWNAGARYALQNNDPKDALEWARVASTSAFPGQENFTTLMTMADAQEANAMQAEAKATHDKAISLPGATASELHQYARGLQQKGKKEDALAVFELNAKRHPNEWPVNVGLARGYSAVGKYKDALKYAKLALAQAPDDVNRNFLKAGIEKLEQGKDLN